ncbi:MAG: metal-sensing transcriptional repressor [Cyanobacteriota bacterium]
MTNKHQTHQDISKRLIRASGHLKKVISMIEEEQPCIEVAQQMQAVIKAIEKAKHIFVTDHIEHCLDEERLKSGNIKELKRELSEISKYL